MNDSESPDFSKVYSHYVDRRGFSSRLSIAMSDLDDDSLSSGSTPKEDKEVAPPEEEAAEEEGGLESLGEFKHVQCELANKAKPNKLL